MAEAAVLDGTAVEITGGHLDWETPQIAPKAERLSEKVPMKTDALPCLLLSGFYPHLDSKMLAGRVIFCSKETRRALPVEFDQLRRKDLKSLSNGESHQRSWILGLLTCTHLQ